MSAQCFHVIVREGDGQIALGLLHSGGESTVEAVRSVQEIEDKMVPFLTSKLRKLRRR